MNSKNIAYTAGKHLRAREALGAIVAVLATHLRDGLRGNAVAPRRRSRRRSAASCAACASATRSSKEISRVYRRHFLSFASPWWVSRPVHEFLLGLPGALVRRVLGRRRPAEHPGRWDAVLRARRALLPDLRRHARVLRYGFKARAAEDRYVPLGGRGRLQAGYELEDLHSRLCVLAACGLAAARAAADAPRRPSRDARPFAPDSFWNAPLADNAPLDARSAAYVRRLQ